MDGTEEKSPAAASYPPGPGMPHENQAKLWIDRPSTLLESCHRLHGDAFTLKLGQFGTIVVLSDPEQLRPILAAPREGVECRPFNEAYRYVMGDHALFLQDGDRHKRLKALIGPLMHEPSGKVYGAKAARAARAAIPGWIEAGLMRPRPEINAIALTALMTLLLGDNSPHVAPVLEMVRARAWGDLRSWKPWTGLSQLRPRIFALLDDEIATRRSAPADDLLDWMIGARGSGGDALSDAEIKDQVMMLMITAVDASATAGAWAAWRLSTEPEVQDRLREEVAERGSDGPYLDAVCKEVLRLHTVVPTVSGRRVSKDADLAGGRVPAGATLAPCQYLAHRRADVFEDPLAFRPERFLGRSWPAHEYFPFGGGQRACAGSTLAPMFVRTLLAALSEIRLFDPKPERARAQRLGTMMAPQSDLEIKATAR